MAMWPVSVAVAILAASPASLFAQMAKPQEASAAVAKYCATCHSPQLHTAGLTLNPKEVAEFSETEVPHAEQWEKVVRKLRAKTMPPPNAPRPDAATYAMMSDFFETSLDRAATAKPNPGKLPLLHRLSGTEYQNAVRDLLALDNLPKEMDYSLLLPQDNASSGFDNIADLLFISPTAMESYLAAAEKISRLAIGDLSSPEMVNIYRLSDELPQDSRVDKLAMGTRGGLAVRSQFPLDGEYVIKVAFAGRSDEMERLEITVDGERAELATIASGRAAGRGGVNTQAIEFRLPVKAGPRDIGVTFLERDEVRDEEVLRPRMRGVGTRLALDTVTISGPYNVRGAGDTPSRRRVFVCRPSAQIAEDDCAKRIFSALVRRAYRRPVVAADIERLMPFYQEGRKEGGFDLGVQRALQRILLSPQFLFRIERDPAGVAPGSLHTVSDLELASRLSFFLWSSIPDDELLDLAIAGKLHTPNVMEQQVRRMLADPKSSALVTNFAEQWLFLRDIEAKKPNEILFADFDETLRDAMRHETDQFLDHVLRGNASVLELLTANYTFVNERLANHYGIPNVHGSDFRRVTLATNDPRGGLLGQGSILTITSYSNRTSPVNRGKWVLENLLSAPPPPPPPNVPALRTESNGTGKPLTMRDAMIQHRADPACASCHSRMDPIGFAMENFDGVGRWRDRDSGNTIDASGVFPDGEKFSGMAGLKAALVSHPAEFVSTIAEKLLMYGIGRNVQYYDDPVIRAIVKESARNNYTFASLVMGVVKSSAFQMRETHADVKSARR